MGIVFLVQLLLSGCGDPSALPHAAQPFPLPKRLEAPAYWYEYYERGRILASTGYAAKAKMDFNHAIAGQQEDRLLISLPEGHLADYLPHRELGIALFRAGKLDDALDELTESLRTAATSRAILYFNRVRAAQVEMEERDMGPPEIYFEGPSGRRTSSGFTYSVKGVVHDDTGIARITLDDYPLPPEIAKRQRVFSVETPLTEGLNSIAVAAVDLAGKHASRTLDILCDHSGPVIELFETKGEPEPSVRGIVSDPSGLRSLVVNGQPWTVTGRHQAYNFAISPDEKTGLTFVATDKAGNITASRIQPAMLDMDEESLPDDSGPLIDLRDTPLETEEKSVILRGAVRDPFPIEEAAVNDFSLPLHGGSQIYFSRRILLREGPNPIRITATSSRGATTVREIVITGKRKNIHRSESRLSIMPLFFDQWGSTGEHLQEIQEHLIRAVNENKRFHLTPGVPISRETGHLSPSLATAYGLRMGTDAILACTLSGLPDSVELRAVLIDSMSGAILATRDLFLEDPEGLPQASFDLLAASLAEDVPMAEGIVTAVNGESVVLDIGAKQGIKVGNRLIAYREGLEMRHPVTGRIIGTEPDILGEITVTKSWDNGSEAVIYRKTGDIRKYDRVITK
ncbi:MAG: hypothetical protein Kow0089_21480 [Desulfobulbaceae bacterium]